MADRLTGVALAYARGHLVSFRQDRGAGDFRVECRCGELLTRRRTEMEAHRAGAEHKAQIVEQLRLCDSTSVLLTDICPGDWHDARRIKRVNLAEFPLTVVLEYEHGPGAELPVDCDDERVSIFRPKSRRPLKVAR